MAGPTAAGARVEPRGVLRATIDSRLGYSDLATFSRAFSMLAGSSPPDWRKAI